jgi:type I restriction enzyme M protein
VVANPPYSIKEWAFETFEADKYGRRNGFDMPPTKNADFAFVLHMIASLNQNGRAGVVLPHGILFRGGSEGRIRKQIIEKDIIETVIAMPAKLFYGVGISVCILILNNNKPAEHKNKILFIDAEKDYLEGKNQNSLREQDIDKIVKAFDGHNDIEKYARVVGLDELKENDFNLNVRRYIENGAENERIDVNRTWKELEELEKEKEKINKEVAGYIKELGY